MVTIVDYGMGNLASVKNILRYLGYDSVISGDIKDITQADKLILPGVGHFGRAMEEINKRGMIEILNTQVMDKKVPVLGICLGMQLLLSSSEEGEAEGLGWIPGQVTRFNPADMGELKVPHMGWDYVKVEQNNPIVNGVDDNSRFYFVHSYHAQCENRENCIATTEYGITFDSIIGRDNIYGAQFHPEKSHKFGMQLLNNFLKL